MAETVDNTLMIEILRDLQKQMREQRVLAVQTSEAVRKLTQYVENGFLANRREFLDVAERMKAHKDDLELMLKAELMGTLTHFQTRIETYLDERLAAREKAD